MKNEQIVQAQRWEQDPLQRILDPQVRAIVDRPPSQTDPSGSYTGKPLDPNEVPQQDADDL